MSRTQLLLIGVLAVELAVGGAFAFNRWSETTPPVPDLAAVESVKADEIRGLVADCRTVEQWSRLAEVYLTAGFYPDAEACYRQAVALDPASADLRFKHAFALERIGLIDDAIAEYQAAINRSHKRAADAWFYLARNHLRLDRDGPAAEAFAKAGDLPAGRFELARLHARAGRWDDASKLVDKLAAEFPTAYPPTSLQYRLAVARNDRPAAAVLADKFPNQRGRLPNPFDTEVDWVFGIETLAGRNRLIRDGLEAVRSGKLPTAEEKFREALSAQWSPDVADKLVEVTFVLGRKPEALKLLTEVVERGGPTSVALWRLGQGYEAVGQSTEALAAWERATRITTDPIGKELWHDLAVKYEQLGQRDKAAAAHAHAYLAAGMEEFAADHAGNAVAAITKATEYDARFAKAWYYLGEVERSRGRSAEAKAAYEKCLQLDPNHGQAMRAVALLKK